MKRALIATVIVLTGSCATVAQGATRHPFAELTHFACRQAQNPNHREMAVTAVMRPVHGTQHMAIKFELLHETAGSPSFTAVHSGDLDRWSSPKDPTLGQRADDVWKLMKVVSNLSGPAVYRLKVDFRWTDAHHRVLQQTHRDTPICRAD